MPLAPLSTLGDVFLVAATACAGLLLGAGLTWLLHRRLARRHSTASPASTISRNGEDLLTFLAAALATAVSAQGMWRVFEHTLHMPFALRLATFSFIEVAMLASALRAHRNVTDPAIGRAGVDGVAVWALTGVSATLSAMDAATVQEATVRLAPPLVAAWLWERGLSIHRRRTGRTGRIHWRLTPERILVRLGLAEPTNRTADEVSALRHITRVARSAKRVRRLRATGAWRWRVTWAVRRLDRAADRAVRHAALATDPSRQRVLTDHLAVLYHAPALADLTPPFPWETSDLHTTAAPASHHLTGDEPVSLGHDAAQAHQYLARRGVNLSPGELLRHLPHRTPGPPAPPERTADIRPRTDARTSVRTAVDQPVQSSNAEPPATARTAVRTASRDSSTMRRTDPDRATSPQPPSQPTGQEGSDNSVAERSTTASDLADEDAPSKRSRPERPGRRTTRGKVTRSDAKALRDELVKELAPQIRAALDADRPWTPDYTALMRRTNLSKSWCEKTVRAAKRAAQTLPAA